MTETEQFSAGVVEKLLEARDLARSQRMIDPVTITINDADGRTIFDRTFSEAELRLSVAFAELNGRLPLTVSITDALGKTIRL
jgi:hypothetical protein